MKMLLALAVLWLAGCASGPVPPDWQMNAHGALKNAVAADLAGNARLADLEFARARTEVSSTGRPDLLARVVLVRCAVQVASLVFDGCAAYAAVAADAGAQERAYADFLAARWPGLDSALLPPQYRALLAGVNPVEALKGIEDPMSRLVAAGVLFQMGRLPPEGIALAGDTASAQGWRRPLLAWLGVQARRAQELGQHDEAARIRRRIDLASGVAAPGP